MSGGPGVVPQICRRGRYTWTCLGVLGSSPADLSTVSVYVDVSWGPGVALPDLSTVSVYVDVSRGPGVASTTGLLGHTRRHSKVGADDKRQESEMNPPDNALLAIVLSLSKRTQECRGFTDFVRETCRTAPLVLWKNDETTHTLLSPRLGAEGPLVFPVSPWTEKSNRFIIHKKPGSYSRRRQRLCICTKNKRCFPYGNTSICGPKLSFLTSSRTCPLTFKVNL